MRLEALLMMAALAVATAGTAVANPQNDTCADKSWLAEMVCKAQHEAAHTKAATPAKAKAADDDSSDAFAVIRALMRPHSAFEWFRTQLGNSTMISSSVRPSTRPAATAPSDATKRKDGTVADVRSP